MARFVGIAWIALVTASYFIANKDYFAGKIKSMLLFLVG